MAVAWSWISTKSLPEFPNKLVVYVKPEYIIQFDDVNMCIQRRVWWQAEKPVEREKKV